MFINRGKICFCCPTIRQGFPKNRIASHTINMLKSMALMVCSTERWPILANTPAQPLRPNELNDNDIHFFVYSLV
jgi:hypothetical protein